MNTAKDAAWLVSGFLIVLVLILAVDALGHDVFKCEGTYRSASGVECCAANVDCHKIPNDVAWNAKVGDTLPLNSIQTMIVNIIHPSCDPDGHAWACSTGCLFRPSGF